MYISHFKNSDHVYGNLNTKYIYIYLNVKWILIIFYIVNTMKCN